MLKRRSRLGVCFAALCLLVTPASAIQSSGTGFLVSSEGHIATNEHVVDGCSEIKVRFRSSPQQFEATVISRDKANDLALLKTSRNVVTTFPVSLNTKLRLGEEIHVFGFPLTGVLSDSGNFTTGSVTSLSGLMNNSSAFQISSPVQPGNSGGPVFDGMGNVVGVVRSKLNVSQALKASGDIPQNVNFAIKAFSLKAFLDSNDVGYDTQVKQKELKAVDIAEMAQNVSAHIICIGSKKTNPQISSGEPQSKSRASRSIQPPASFSPNTVRIGIFEDWGAFASDQPNGRLCFAMTQPISGAVAQKAFLFVSFHPKAPSWGEVSAILGFGTVDNSIGTLELEGRSFAAVTRGSSLWLKVVAQDRELITGMSSAGGQLKISAATAAGKNQTQTYSLNGFSQSLRAAGRLCGR